MSRRLVLGFSSLIICCLIVYLWVGVAWTTHKSLHDLANIDAIEFKQHWKKILSTGTLPKNFCFMYIKRNRISYYAANKQDARINIILKSIQELVKNKKTKIPNGYYFISVDDRVNNNTIWPILAFTASEQQLAEHKVILMPDNKALTGYEKKFRTIDLALNKITWNERINKIFWRGSLSGEAIYIDTRIEQIPRLRMLKYIQNLQFVDAAITSLPMYIRDSTTLYDMDKSLHLKPFVKIENALNFKYMLDIDGNSCSFSRMAWLLYSKSLIFKVKSDQKQWYYNKMHPGVHYLEVAQDFSNLEQLYYWAQENPEQTQMILHNARKLAEQTFNHKAIQQDLQMALINYHALIH